MLPEQAFRSFTTCLPRTFETQAQIPSTRAWFFADSWQFRVGAAAVTHMPHGPFRSADVEQIRAAVLADIGLAQVPAWAVAAELAAGALLEVIPDLARPPLGINAIHPAGRRLPSKVRVSIEHLEASFAHQHSTAFL